MYLIPTEYMANKPQLTVNLICSSTFISSSACDIPKVTDEDMGTNKIIIASDDFEDIKV